MTPDELRKRNFITVQELAADVLGVDERTARRAIEQGQIPAVKVGNKTLIPAPRLAELIAPSVVPTGGALAAVAAEPSAIPAAVEILRGALRALEALASPGTCEAGPAPSGPALDLSTAPNAMKEAGSA